jgi:hypothetical protein
LACDHYHVIFTLPYDLNPLWLANVPVMSTLLFQVVRDTRVALLADPKYLGAQPGIIAALHTWRQPLVLHPHLHCFVPGGGLPPDGHGQAVRNGFLLPGRVVMAVLRGKMLRALRRALARDELVLPEAIRPQQLLTLLNRLGQPRKTRWPVCMMERYAHGAGVVTSLARYLRGGPLKNARLVAGERDRLTFTARTSAEARTAGATPRSCVTMSSADCLQRWLLHVPAPQTRVVRSYGLSNHTHAEAWGRCRAQLGQPPVVVPVRRDWQTACAQRGEAHPERCRAWGPLLVCTGVIPRGGAPPPVWVGERVA